LWELDREADPLVGACRLEGPHWNQLGLDIWLSLWDQPIGKDVGTVYLRREGGVEVLIWEFKGVLRVSLEVAISELLDGE
jgi:hypothetical protein